MAGNDRQELEELRRIDELEAKASGGAQPASAPNNPATAKTAAPPTVDVIRNAAYGGAAAIPDALLNAPNQLLNLGKAAVGTGATALGRPDLAPDLTEDPNFVQKMVEKAGLTKSGVKPQGAQKALDVLIRGGVGGALTGGASIPKALMGSGMGSLASGTGAATEAVIKGVGGSESAQAAGGNIAGLLAPRGAAAAAGTMPRAATERGAAIPPERLEAYRSMAKHGARPSAGSLIYGEQNKNVKGQQKVANETWNEAVGLPKKQDFGVAEIDAGRKKASADYEHLLSNREVTFDKPFFDQFKGLYDKQRMLSETGVTFAEARPIIATLERIANLPASIKERISQLKDIPADTTSPGATKRALAVIDDALKAGATKRALAVIDDALKAGATKRALAVIDDDLKAGATKRALAVIDDDLKAGAAGEWKMDAKDYNEVRSILGKDAQRSRRDKNRSGLLWKMQQAFDDAADRSMPDIAHELGAVRGRYENLMILSDAMEGKGPGFVTPAQIGKEVAQREGHRSLYPNQSPLKALGRQGLSLSGDAAIDGGVNLSGVAAHIPKGGISMTAVERALATPLTAMRARGMGKEGFYENAKRREAELKEAARRSIIPLAANE
jgi:hypothetical protein